MIEKLECSPHETAWEIGFETAKEELLSQLNGEEK
jgi:hypothetical protein